MTAPRDEAAGRACKHPAGVLVPVIDPNRCEGKAACAAECPYGVFVVRRRERAELPGLSVLGTIKWWMHGGIQAQAVDADQCHGCGLCVNACPESAITLSRVTPARAHGQAQVRTSADPDGDSVPRP